MSGWRKISSLPDVPPNANHVVLWNPCDGLHLLDVASLIVEIDEIKKGKVFTHWRSLEGPRERAKP